MAFLQAFGGVALIFIGVFYCWYREGKAYEAGYEAGNYDGQQTAYKIKEQGKMP